MPAVISPLWPVLKPLTAATVPNTGKRERDRKRGRERERRELYKPWCAMTNSSVV